MLLLLYVKINRAIWWVMSTN